MLRLSDDDAQRILVRYKFAFGAVLVVLLLYVGSQMMEVVGSSSHRQREVNAWRAGFLASRWETYKKKSEALRTEIASSSTMQSAANAGSALIARLESMLDQAKTAFSSAFEVRVKEVVSTVVAAGWSEAQAHFRSFHAHDRVGVSPLLRINLPISITTRKTKWTQLSDLALLKTLLPSLLRTMESGYLYGVYLGYDVGDPLLDRAGAEAGLRQLWEQQCLAAGKEVELKMFRYNDTINHNVWAVNYITKEAYLDGYDYFFRVNDDSEFKETGWTSLLVEALQRNEDFGAAGVLDPDNPRIWTHSFVSRTHIEIFGFHFPFSFGNYWSDDWITLAYTRKFSVWLYNVPITHHRQPERYKVNWTDSNLRLSIEVERAQQRWALWLCKTRDAAEYCVNASSLPSHHHDSDSGHDKGDTSKVVASNALEGLDRETLLAMENEAKEEAIQRLKKLRDKKRAHR